MDNIKLFAKNGKELKILIQAVRIYSRDIGIEFGREKCAVLIMRSRKQEMTEGIKLPNQQKIRTLVEKETYKNLRRLEEDTIKYVEIKEKIKKEYLKRRKLLEMKLYRRNLIKGINSWAFQLVRYLGPFLKWTREKLQQMNQKKRKLMMMHKALHPRHDTDSLYTSRKEGRRGLTNIEDSIDRSIRQLKNYNKKKQNKVNNSDQKQH